MVTRGAPGWLLCWAVAYNVGHHLGLLPDGLGPAGGGTLWGDWIDLLVPYAVIGTALAALATSGFDRREGIAALVGSVSYVQGHGVHLAANSIGNERGDRAPVHLWDEVVGHALWYAGLAVLVAVLARALSRTHVPTGWVARVLAVLTGTTWTTNTLGADQLLLAGLLVALGLAACGWQLRGSGAGQLLLTAFLPSAAVLGAFAVLGA